jgi:dihydroxy-acid dehydratase
MEDLHEVGGVPVIMKYLFFTECLTVTGKTLAENLLLFKFK